MPTPGLSYSLSDTFHITWTPTSVTLKIQVYHTDTEIRQRNATPGYIKSRLLREITHKHLVESTHYPPVTSATFSLRSFAEFLHQTQQPTASITQLLLHLIPLLIAIYTVIICN
jgi:hypothetical protein